MKPFAKFLIGIILLFVLYYLLCSLLGLAIWVLIIAVFVAIAVGALKRLFREKTVGKKTDREDVKMDRAAEKRAERALKDLERKSKNP